MQPSSYSMANRYVLPVRVYTFFLFSNANPFPNAGTFLLENIKNAKKEK